MGTIPIITYRAPFVAELTPYPISMFFQDVFRYFESPMQQRLPDHRRD